MLFATSQWKLGVRSVLATNGPVASTLFASVGPNYNCADPCAGTSINTMVATASVHVQWSGADIAAAGAEMAIQSAMEFFISWLLDRKLMSALWSKLGSRFLGNSLEKVGNKLAAALTPAGKKLARKELEEQLHKAIMKALLEDSPFGPTAINEIWQKSIRSSGKTAEEWIKGAIGDPVKWLVGLAKDGLEKKLEDEPEVGNAGEKEAERK